MNTISIFLKYFTSYSLYGVIYVAILYLIIYLFHIKNMYSILRYLLPIKYIYSQYNIYFRYKNIYFFATWIFIANRNIFIYDKIFFGNKNIFIHNKNIYVRCIYNFLQTKYALIQYFMWTIKITIYRIYIYIYLPKKKKRNYWQFLLKSNIHCKLKKYIYWVKLALWDMMYSSLVTDNFIGSKRFPVVWSLVNSHLRLSSLDAPMFAGYLEC